MSGKAKTAQKGSGGKGPNDTGYRHDPPNIARVLVFRRNTRGTLVPKLVWERGA